MRLARILRVMAAGAAVSLSCAPLAISPVAFSPAARAQDEGGGELSSREAIALRDQIEALRQQVTQMQDSQPIAPPSSGGGGGSPAPEGNMTAQLLERVTALEDQNRQMRGELDQLSNTVKEMQANLSKQISDMQFAAQNGGVAPPSGPKEGGPKETTKGEETGAGRAEAEGAAPPPRTALDALHEGNAALKAGNYAEAETDARYAVRTAKSVPGRMDAQFLLAQSLAGQKNYRQSALAYYDAYNKAPKSAKAQDSLLGVAASLLAMGDKSSACQALEKLNAEFPNQGPRVKAAAATFRARGSCR